MSSIKWHIRHHPNGSVQGYNGYIDGKHIYFITHNLITGHHVCYKVAELNASEGPGIIFDQLLITKHSKVRCYKILKDAAKNHLKGVNASETNNA